MSSSPNKTIMEPEAELDLNQTTTNLKQMSINIESSDTSDDALIGTPTSVDNVGFGSNQQNSFASHRFFGPTKGEPNSRSLHGIRRVDIHSKSPQFNSEAISVVAPENSLVGDSSVNEHLFGVTFTEENIGFQPSVVIEDDKVKVKIVSVEKNSAAKRAGVVEGDCLISVNGQAIEYHMTEEQVLSVIAEASNPRTILFLRISDKDLSSGYGIANNVSALRKSFLDIGVSTPLNALKGFLAGKYKNNQKSNQMQSDEMIYCDGCGVSSFEGSAKSNPLNWSCSVCLCFNLCNSCYAQGLHGMENTESMQMLNEAIVQEKLKKRCKQFTPEFLLSLRRDICKGRIDKFEYMGSWLADIVGNTPATKITVRGIEIPLLTPNARQRFVAMLMPLASNREDIEVHIEWFPHAAKESEDSSSDDEDSTGMEKLRVWVSDKKLRTTSPFLK